MKTKNHINHSMQKKKVGLFIAVFAVITSFFLLRILSAAPFLQVEPEASLNTIVGATIEPDPNAAGGSYVRFNDPPPPPPPDPGPDPDPPPTSGPRISKFVGGYNPSWGAIYPSQISQQYNFLFHAFGTIGPDGSIGFWVNHDRTRLAQEYRDFVAEGKVVILSIGGEGGAQAGLGTQSQRDNFVNSLIPLINEFNFSGIDWDLEAGVPGGISPEGLAAVSRQMKQTFGDDFLITAVPYGDPAVENPYKELARLLGDDLDMVAYQFYNMSVPVTADVVRNKIEEWRRETGFPSERFSVGFWHGPWWNGITTDINTMVSVYSEVEQTYPNLLGAWVWDIPVSDFQLNNAFGDRLAQVVFN